jgi:hypothetical protein
MRQEKKDHEVHLVTLRTHFILLLSFVAPTIGYSDSSINYCDQSFFSEKEDLFPDFVPYDSDQNSAEVISNTLGCRYDQEFWSMIPSVEPWTEALPIKSSDGSMIGNVDWFAAPHDDPLNGYAIVSADKAADFTLHRFAVPLEAISASENGALTSEAAMFNFVFDEQLNAKFSSPILPLETNEVYPGKFIDGIDFEEISTLIPQQDFFAPNIVTNDRIKQQLVMIANRFGNAPLEPDFTMNINVQSTPSNALITVNGARAGTTHQRYVIKRKFLESIIISHEGYEDCGFEQANTEMNTWENVFEIDCLLTSR